MGPRKEESPGNYQRLPQVGGQRGARRCAQPKKKLMWLGKGGNKEQREVDRELAANLVGETEGGYVVGGVPLTK